MPPSRLLIALALLFGLSLPLLALGNQDFLQLQQEIRSERPVRQLAISADEAILALGMQDGDDTVVEFRDRRSGRILGNLRSASNELTHLSFHPTRRQLFVGGDKRLELWQVDDLPGRDAELPALQQRIWERTIQQSVGQANFSQQKDLLRWSEGQQLYELDTQPPYSSRLLWTGEKTDQPLKHFAFSPNEQRIAVSHANQTGIRLVDSQRQQVLPPLDYHLLPPVDFHFSTDQQLVSIDEERNLLWGNSESRLQEHRPELELSNQSKPERLLPLPGDKLAVISTEGDTTKAHIFNREGAEQQQLLLHGAGSIARSPTGAYLASADYDSVQLFETKEHQSPEEYIRQLQDRGANETARRYRNQLDTPVALATSKAAETSTGPSSLELQVEQLRNAEREKDWLRAERLLGDILRIDPQNAEALAVRERMQQQEQEIQLGKGEQLLKNGEYDAAISQFKQVPKDSPLYTEARRQLALAEQQIRVQLRVQSAEQEMRSQNWEGARTFLLMALEQDPNNSQVQSLLEEIEAKQTNARLVLLAVLLMLLLIGGLLGWFGWKYRERIAGWMSQEDPRQQARARAYAEAQAAVQAEEQRKAAEQQALDEQHFQETLRKTRELLRLAQRKDTERQHAMRLVDFEAEINLIERQALEKQTSLRQLAGKLLFIQQTLRSLRFYVRARTSQRAEEQQQRRQQQSKQQERQQPGSSRTSAVGQNYYELLGISPKATVSEIRKAYHEKLKEYHPDRHQNAEFDWIRKQAESMTRLLGEAYEVLVHEEQRKRYDQQQQQQARS